SGDRSDEQADASRRKGDDASVGTEPAEDHKGSSRCPDQRPNACPRSRYLHRRTPSGPSMSVAVKPRQAFSWRRAPPTPPPSSRLSDRFPALFQSVLSPPLSPHPGLGESGGGRTLLGFTHPPLPGPGRR